MTQVLKKSSPGNEHGELAAPQEGPASGSAQSSSKSTSDQPAWPETQMPYGRFIWTFWVVQEDKLQNSDWRKEWLALPYEVRGFPAPSS